MTKNHSNIVKSHFNKKYGAYDSLIIKLIPKYEKIQKIIVSAIGFDRAEKIHILELGIGTGQLAKKALERYGESILTGLDISKRMLEKAKKNLSAHKERLIFVEGNMTRYVPKKIFDSCIALLSVHHLNSAQKKNLFKKIYRSLSGKGTFVIGDIIKGDSHKKTYVLERKWKNYLIKSIGKKSAKYYFNNYLTDDLPSSIPEHVEYLKGAGFKRVRVLFEFMNTAVIFAKK